MPTRGLNQCLPAPADARVILFFKSCHSGQKEAGGAIQARFHSRETPLMGEGLHKYFSSDKNEEGPKYETIHDL